MQKFSPYIGIPVIMMGLVVVLSNVLVTHPINDWLTWGAFTYPLCFLVNDVTNRHYGRQQARTVVYAGFMVGLLLSFIAGDARIAIASGTAFLLAQLLDVHIFYKLRQKSWWQAPLFSTVIASFLDSLLFFAIAFAGTGLPWVKLAVGDFGIKIFMGFCLLPVFRLFTYFAPKASTKVSAN